MILLTTFQFVQYFSLWSNTLKKNLMTVPSSSSITGKHWRRTLDWLELTDFTIAKLRSVNYKSKTTKIICSKLVTPHTIRWSTHQPWSIKSNLVIFTYTIVDSLKICMQMVSSFHRYLSVSFLTSNRQVGCRFNLCHAVLLNNLLCFWILSDDLDLFFAIFWKPWLFVSHHN